MHNRGGKTGADHDHDDIDDDEEEHGSYDDAGNDGPFVRQLLGALRVSENQEGGTLFACPFSFYTVGAGTGSASTSALS